MQLSERRGFSKLLGDTAEIFGKKLSETQAEMYWNLLKDFPWHAVRFAFEQHMLDPKHGKYMPLPADLIAKTSSFKSHSTEGRSCQYLDEGRPCGLESMVNARFKNDQDYYLCYQHWDSIRLKNDSEKEIDRIRKRQEAWAKEAGCSHREIYDDWKSGLSLDKQTMLNNIFK